VHTAAGEVNRQALMAAYPKISEASLSLSAEMWNGLSSTWMYCSYAASPDKHRFKQALNEVVRRTCEAEGMKSRSRAYRKSERPVLLVAAERMHSGSAMHRSYAACLEQLRSRFKMVCITRHDTYTADCAELFDEVMLIDDKIRLQEIGALIVKLSPDLIYYPSLGMSDWTIAMATQRFAPIQFMTLGHPAPAMMDTMDYSLVQAGHGEAAHEFGNKVLERKALGHFVPLPELLSHTGSREESDDGVLHIAINSSKMKLSPRFLALCERLEATATRPLHLHFFASAGGVVFDLMQQMLEGRFRNMTLHPPRHYGEFLNHLQQCDLALSAFPFGNTNSTVDTCVLGIPTVAYVANEVLSIGDRDVLRMAGMPAWLVSDNDEDYFKVATRLIHDDGERSALRKLLKAGEVHERLFKAPRPEDDTEFVDAVWWMYENHQALLESPAHTLKVGEPIPGPAGSVR
jgi:hypothetical protein